jgi:hypothetical protein
MRSELEQIERIESYLLGGLNPAERIRFENDLAIDPSLKENFTLQKEILEGIERVELMQIAEASFGRWQFLRVLKITALCTGICGAAVITYFTINSYSSENEKAITFHPRNSEIEATSFLTAFSPVTQDESFEMESEQILSAQNNSTSTFINKGIIIQPVKEKSEPVNTHFTPERDKKSFYNFSILKTTNLPMHKFIINNRRDTTLYLKSGTVIHVSPYSFQTFEKESKKTDDVELSYMEALTMEDIVKGGLFTTTGDFRMLESGGMYFLSAQKKNGEHVGMGGMINISWINSPHKEGMKLFSSNEVNLKIDSLPARIIWSNPREVQPLTYKTKENDFEYKKKTVREWFASLFRSEKNQKKYEEDETTYTAESINRYDEDSTVITSFASGNSGWAGITRYFHSAFFENADLKVKIKDADDFTTLSVSLAFRNNNVYIPAYRTADGSFTLTHATHFQVKIPVEEKAIILVTATKGDDTYFTFKHITTSSEMNLELTPVRMKQERIMEAIGDLF